MRTIPYYLFSFCLSAILALHPTLNAVAADRAQPSTLSQPKSTSRSPVQSSTVSKPTSSGQPYRVKQPKMTPTSKIQSGYCCADGVVKKSDQKSCARVRGTFFTDQRSAVRSCENEKGYCCKDGETKQATRKKCKTLRGAFFSKENDAQRTCNGTRGYCCDEGKVSAETKGTCTKKQGKFFIAKKDAEILCAKTQGYCSSESGVARMTQEACTRGKGKFFIRKQQADIAWKNTRGFCCDGSKIIAASRALCRQKKGKFSTNRMELAKQCSSSAKHDSKKIAAGPKKTAPIATAAAVSPSSTKSAKALTQKPIAKQAVDPTLSKKQNLPQNSPGLTPGAGNSAMRMNTGNSNLKLGGSALAVTAGAAALQTVQPANNIQQAVPTSPGIGSPQATINYSGPHIAFFIDQFLYVGSSVQEVFGASSSANVNSIKGDLDITIQCNAAGKLDRAEVFLLGGDQLTNIQQQTNASGHVQLKDVTLSDKSNYQLSSCREGDYYYAKKPSGLKAQLNYWCKLGDTGTPKQFEQHIELPLEISCDRRVGVIAAQSSSSEWYIHHCPEGYKFEQEPRVVEKSNGLWAGASLQGPNRPVSCIKE